MNIMTKAKTLDQSESICSRCSVICGPGHQYQAQFIGGLPVCGACLHNEKIDSLDGIRMMLATSIGDAIHDRSKEKGKYLFADPWFVFMVCMASPQVTPMAVINALCGDSPELISPDNIQAALPLAESLV